MLNFKRSWQLNRDTVDSRAKVSEFDPLDPPLLQIHEYSINALLFFSVSTYNMEMKKKIFVSSSIF